MYVHVLYMCVYIYPLAFGLPATVPWQVICWWMCGLAGWLADWLNGWLTDWLPDWLHGLGVKLFVVCVFLYCCAGDLVLQFCCAIFVELFKRFLCLPDWLNGICSKLFDVVVFLSCCAGARFLQPFCNVLCDFCAFWCHFGTLLVSVGVFWRPWGSPGHPLRRHVEKVTKMLVRWPPFGIPLGSLWGQFSILFCVFSICVLYIFLKRFFEGFCSLWGPTPTVKTMVSCTRNHCFHISTWSSKIIENYL